MRETGGGVKHRAGTHRQAELDGVHRLVERPGELMLPQSLHHHVLHVLQLVGFPEGHIIIITQGAEGLVLGGGGVPRVTYLPGLVGLVTSGGGGLVTVGGLGGAASGASDMVDDGDAAMHCGTAVSDRKVRKQLPLWCGVGQGAFRSEFSSTFPRGD